MLPRSGLPMSAKRAKSREVAVFLVYDEEKADENVSLIARGSQLINASGPRQREQPALGTRVENSDVAMKLASKWGIPMKAWFQNL